MKKNLFNLFAIACLFLVNLTTVFALNEKVNLTITNLNMGYDNYNPDTKTISGIYFGVGAGGTDSKNFSVGFTVNLVLLPVGAQTLDAGPIVWTQDVADGKLPEMGTYNWQDLSIDLSQVPNLASGTYMLYAYVVGYEQNNAGFDEPNIAFTSGPAKSKADLQIASVSYTFDQGMGTLSNIVIKLQNSGEIDAAASTISLYVEETQIQGSNTGSMSVAAAAVAGATTAEVKPDDINLGDVLFMYNPQSTYKLTFTADSKGVVAESNEDNNVYVIQDVANVTAVAQPLKAMGITIPNPVSREYLLKLASNGGINAITVFSANGSAYTVESATAGLNMVQFSTSQGTETRKLIIE